MHLLLDVVLPAADERLELAEGNRVDPIISKCLTIHRLLKLKTRWPAPSLPRGQRKGSAVQREGGRVQDVRNTNTNEGGLVVHRETHIPAILGDSTASS